MGTSNGDLIQALVESYNDNIDYDCGVLDGDWCTLASALTSNGQQGGTQVHANAGDEVQMNCECRCLNQRMHRGANGKRRSVQRRHGKL
jgi:hypothetical protein